MSPPSRWPLDLDPQSCASATAGAQACKEPEHAHHHKPEPPAHGGDLPPGAVRARLWRGEGDVRVYRLPSGWTASADLTDIHPITGRALARAVWRIIETKE